MAKKGQALNARKHGTRSTFATQGDETALLPAELSRLAELRLDVQTSGGVIAQLQERAARSVLICEMAESWIEKQAKDGKAVLELPIMARLATYQAEARRCLTALVGVMGKSSTQNITDLLKGDSTDDK